MMRKRRKLCHKVGGVANVCLGAIQSTGGWIRVQEKAQMINTATFWPMPYFQKTKNGLGRKEKCMSWM